VIGVSGQVAAVAVAYFLAAQLGLALRAEPSDVAVFWPAAGIAAGVLVLCGRRASPGLALGVIIGTVAANLLSDRLLLTSVFKGLCNAGEAVLVACLLERWFGRAFAFSDIRKVFGFLAAAVLAAATSAVGGAATMTALHTVAPFWEVWRTWFLSDGVGIVVVAPLVIGFGQAWRKQYSRPALLEATSVLALLAVISFYIVTYPSGSWLSFSPGAVVLPLLLWLAARGPPAFAIAGAFSASLAVICATNFGLGRFGDAAVPIVERVKGAQVAVTMVTTYTLVLTALFAERRAREDGFRRLLGALPAAVYTTDRAGRITYCNQAAIDLWGHTPELGKDNCFDLCRLAYPDGTPMPLDDRPTQICLLAGRPVVGREALLERPDGSRVPIIPCPAPLIDEQGTVIGVISMKLDISERKRAELALAERNLQLSLAAKTALVGSYSYDVGKDIMQVSEGYAAVHGLAAGTVETTRSDWQTRTHPDDLARVESMRKRAFRERHTEYEIEYRIVRPEGEVRWIESRSFISYDLAGIPRRVIGVNIDITQRKRLAEMLAERNAQLELASKVARIGSFSYDYATRLVQLSPSCAAIYGLSEATREIDLKEARSRLHPDDLLRVDAICHRAYAQQRSETVLDFRITPNAQIRWIEARILISYVGGRARRMVGAIIDITERKKAEQSLAERNAQLDLAHRAARVGSYTYDIQAKAMRIARASAAIYGLSHSTMEIKAQQWFARVHRDDMLRLQTEYRRAFKERRNELVNEFRFVRPGGEIRWLEARSLIDYDADGRAERMTGVYIDVTERRKAEDHKSLLIAELDHRVKNVLACVAAVTQHSREYSKSTDEFIDVLNGRINALANTHALLSRSRWEGVGLAELVRTELAFWAKAKSTSIEGPEIDLAAEATQPVAMVLHELATNAAKYGALSSADGRVLVRWRRPPKGQPNGTLVLEWREIGGPPVAAANAKGFGTSVICDVIPYELGGAVHYQLAREGACCRLEIPAKWWSQPTRVAEALQGAE
jgi:PAS domain S-box-containing protein